MTPSGHTRVYAVVGHPVRHSRSPAIYNPLFAEHGIDAVYVALEVAPERADRVADAVRTLGLAGVNLTVPHKEAVLPHLDEVAPEAAAAGAVNVVVNDGGRLVGHNTDADGFVESLIDDHGVHPEGLRVVVLGAGGASRAVASGLARRGASRITLLNRTVSRAQAAVDHLRAHHEGTELQAGPLSPGSFAQVAEQADLVVNGTSGGAAGTVARLDVTALAPHAVWSDLNYWMDEPPLLAACRGRGLRVQDGLSMLAWQAALAFRLFTGHAVDAGRVARSLR